MGAFPGAASGVDGYRTLFENVRDGVWIAGPDGRLTAVNPALIHLVGYGRDQLLRMDERALFADPDEWRRVRERLAEDGAVRDLEVRLLRSDGREVVGVLRAVAEHDRDGGLLRCHGMVHDVTEWRRAEERRRHEGQHDPLTHLPNRAAFVDRVSRLLRRVPFRDEGHHPLAVLLVDVDRFKRINASMGRAAGDALLVHVAQRLGQLVRPEDIVGRAGGDEFAVLLLDVPGREGAEAAAVRIQEGLRRPFAVEGSEVYVGVSVGIALSLDGGETGDRLVSDAQTAMHVASARGPGGRAVFDARMRERASALLTTENALRRGLERGEFELHYQPFVSMASGTLRGFEALVRWRHPTRGLLPPAEFLDVAEESGLIVPLGEWVLDEACRTAAAWRSEGAGGRPPPMVAVNLSARQLAAPGLAATVGRVLDAHGLPGSSLRLEITESVFLERSGALMESLEALAALGVTLCLDDFGTVYSTLAYLRDLPVHTLKIDRSFIGRLAAVDGAEMVRTILMLARHLGVEAVAEGVETVAQMERLLRLGCEDAQGFLFSVPLDAERARRVVMRGKTVGPRRGARSDGEPATP